MREKKCYIKLFMFLSLLFSREIMDSLLSNVWGHKKPSNIAI